MISTWLAASYTGGSGSVTGRIALVAVTVLAVGAYGYPPGYEPYPLYDQARSPWTARDQAGSDRRS
jgi:hypothetical protein